jgi:hypothetical protein
VSYRRESTPAYGGPDLQRRDETVRQIAVADDAGRSACGSTTCVPASSTNYECETWSPTARHSIPPKRTLRCVI